MYNLDYSTSLLSTNLDVNTNNLENNKTDFNYFSFILYVDHRTDRIERYLINTSNPNVKTIDNKEDLFITFNDKKY